MLTPYTNKPKITQADINNGYVVRYFVRNVSTKVVTEIDKKQYEAFKNNVLYEKLELQWRITGFANNILATDNNIIYGTKHSNTVTTQFYEKRLPGLQRILRNPLEYFQGTMNKEPDTPPSEPRYSSTLGGSVGIGRTFGNEIVSPPTTTSSIIQPDYWWRADSGLTTSSWTASNGGIDFTFSNVTTASSAVGAVFNGTNGFGQTSILSSNIAAKHVLIRLDSISASELDTIMGGTQNNIHQIAHSASGFWSIIDAPSPLTGPVRYGTRTNINITSPSPTLLWFDFENGNNAVNVYTDNNSSVKASIATYTGTYNNLFTWLSGSRIYLARRQQSTGPVVGVTYGRIRMNVKELAIFTSSLSYEQGNAVRAQMLARWP